MTPISRAPRVVPEPSPGADAFDPNITMRLTAADVPGIRAVRLKPHGADAKLMNISTTGMLTECTSRMKVGSAVAILFEGSFPVQSTVGRVARCEVGAMGRDGILRYHVAIAFNQPLAPEVLPGTTAPAPINPLDARDPIAAIAAVVAQAPVAVRNRW